MSTSIGFDIYAKDTASAKFDNLGNKIDGTSTKFAKIGQVAKVAGLALAAGIGAGAVALVGMTKNAIEDDAAQRKLAIGLQNATGATDAQVASVEKYISAQGKALGVTDDELRPAFQRLVEATGSVKKAQEQMSIAMDVSAGTGKSLKTVSEALMKANNGTTASLSKLGLKTKDAQGNTLSLDDALKSMSQTFEGQATAKANTLEGKMGRLKVMFDETKETIGSALIPILTDLGDWILGTGVPAIERFVQGWKDGTGAGGNFAAIVGTVGSAVSSTAAFIKENATALSILAGALGTAYVGFKALMFVKTVTTAVAAFNVMLAANPIGLVVVALVALTAGLVIAYKRSETFREVVNGALGAVSGAFDRLGDVCRNVLNGMQEKWAGFKDRLGDIKESIGRILSNIFDPIQGAWSSVREWIGERWAAFREFVGGWQEGLSGRLDNIFDGIRAAWTSVREWVDGKWAAFRDWAAGLTLNFSGAFDGIGVAFRSAVNSIISAWNNLSFGIPAFDPPGPGKFPGVTVSTPNVPFLAEGGIVRQPTMAVVGESGPEAVIPLSRLGGALGGAPTEVTYNFTINDATDPQAVVAAIQAYTKRNGPLRGLTA